MGAGGIDLGVLTLLPDWEAAFNTVAAARRMIRNSLFIGEPRADTVL